MRSLSNHNSNLVMMSDDDTIFTLLFPYTAVVDVDVAACGTTTK